MMLGLTIEKAIIIAVLIGFLFGPERLVTFSQHLGSWIRTSRDWIGQAQHRARAEFGADVESWTDLDPRRYDPRRIIRNALADDSAPATSPETEPDFAEVPSPRRRRRSDGHWETITAETSTAEPTR